MDLGFGRRRNRYPRTVSGHRSGDAVTQSATGRRNHDAFAFKSQFHDLLPMIDTVVWSVAPAFYTAPHRLKSAGSVTLTIDSVSLLEAGELLSCVGRIVNIQGQMLFRDHGPERLAQVGCTT